MVLHPLVRKENVNEGGTDQIKETQVTHMWETNVPTNMRQFQGRMTMNQAVAITRLKGTIEHRAQFAETDGLTLVTVKPNTKTVITITS